MRNNIQTTMSAFSSRSADAGDGMGDVRVFWFAAAIAILMVVAVVAFKLNGQDLRTSVFGNVTAWTQQMTQAGGKSTGAGRDLALQAEPGTAAATR